MRDLDAPQDEFATFNELVNIVADADMNHGLTIEGERVFTNEFWGFKGRARYLRMPE
jgi:hypothetical protein